jgi:hypothetical protein
MIFLLFSMIFIHFSKERKMKKRKADGGGRYQLPEVSIDHREAIITSLDRSDCHIVLHSR